MSARVARAEVEAWLRALAAPMVPPVPADRGPVPEDRAPASSVEHPDPVAEPAGAPVAAMSGWERPAAKGAQVAATARPGPVVSAGEPEPWTLGAFGREEFGREGPAGAGHAPTTPVRAPELTPSAVLDGGSGEGSAPGRGPRRSLRFDTATRTTVTVPPAVSVPAVSTPAAPGRAPMIAPTAWRDELAPVTDVEAALAPLLPPTSEPGTGTTTGVPDVLRTSPGLSVPAGPDPIAVGDLADLLAGVLEDEARVLGVLELEP
ncbi:hypothetical protein [Frankia sp. QA3]|uniref:hypothetical protein n=1 Tax=Frankia sp. QA3 TaxID=710111 RepID=UPI000269BC88|nr:hypothetical protein [Frankia sp. QA3]EIV92702.1 hypothetical protein FraQA3DRAFT_2312 [Frankia sp. QA3]